MVFEFHQGFAGVAGGEHSAGLLERLGRGGEQLLVVVDQQHRHAALGGSLGLPVRGYGSGPFDRQVAGCGGGQRMAVGAVAEILAGLEGEREGEDGAAGDVVAHRDVASVSHGDEFGIGQSQPGTERSGHAVAFDLVIGVEDFRPLFGVHAGAVVADVEHE